jgi:hypothetical protein
LEFEKVTQANWPFLIVKFKSQNKMIDPQSNYQLALALFQAKNIDRSQAIISHLIGIFYPPAILLLAQDILNNNQNKPNLQKLLKTLIEKYEYPPAADLFSHFCIRLLVPPNEVIPILEKGRLIGSNTCSIALGMIRSSASEPYEE